MVQETPELFQSSHVQQFMEQELSRGSKQWIHYIIAGTQEKDQVITHTSDFILLPDTERVNRYRRALQSWGVRHCKRYHSAHIGQDTGRTGVQILNWLAIITETGLRSLRDLRGRHVPMLVNMLSKCMEAIEKRTGIKEDQVMAYVHYPPSVYQLHIHFSYPYGQYCHRDTYRIHGVQTIIDNLRMDGDYYTKATLQLAMFRHSPHFAAVQNHRSGSSMNNEASVDVKNREPSTKGVPDTDSLITDHVRAHESFPMRRVPQDAELPSQ